MTVPRQTAIVLTTIFEPAFLAGFLDAIRQSGREQSTTIDIIIDRKTPESVMRAAEDARRMGFRVHCPSLAEQDQFLQKIGADSFFGGQYKGRVITVHSNQSGEEKDAISIQYFGCLNVSTNRAFVGSLS